MKKLPALIKKEFLQIMRDPSSLVIAFVLPLVLLFIFGYGVNLDSGKIKIAMIVEQKDQNSRAIVDSFTGSRFFDVFQGTNTQYFKNELSAGRINGIVVIPQDFSRCLLDEQRQAKIQIIADGSIPNSAKFAAGYSKGAIERGLLYQSRCCGAGIKPVPINMESRFWYNQELKSRNFLIPGSLALVMTLIGVLLTSLVIAREWERGTMEAILATPVGIAQILLGKLIPYFILALASMFMSCFVGVTWFEVPFRGSFFVLVLVSSVFLTSALGQGLLISTVAKDQYLAAQLALLSGFLPSFMLSGFIFEISSMPTPIAGLCNIFSTKYLVSALQTIFLAGDVWPLLIRSIISMGIISLVFFLLIIKKSSKRIDS